MTRPKPKLKLHRPGPGGPRVLKLLGRHKPFLLALLASPRGLNDDELALATAAGSTNARYRRYELVLLGLARGAGTSRLSFRGAKAAVWQLTPAGFYKARQLQRKDKVKRHG